MIVLGIDTSTSFAGVGLSVDGKLSVETWWSRHNHGREVMPAVMRLLGAAGLTASDLDVVAVALGPGGFSAVRVGIATAQGLVAPSDAKLIGVPTHLMQAYPYRNDTAKRIVSLIPVGRNQVSFSIYNAPFNSLSEETDTGIKSADEISSRFNDADVILCGEGATEDATDSPRSPEHLIAIAIERLGSGAITDVPLEPIYSRPPTITAPRAP